MKGKPDSVSMIHPVSALFFYIWLMKGGWSHCNEHNDFWERSNPSDCMKDRDNQSGAPPVRHELFNLLTQLNPKGLCTSWLLYGHF